MADAAGRDRGFRGAAEDRSAVYSYEQRHQARLRPEEESRFRANASAWAWFENQAPSYRTGAAWWVTTAKRPETRARRLATLIEASGRGSEAKTLTPRGAA